MAWSKGSIKLFKIPKGCIRMMAYDDPKTGEHFMIFGVSDVELEPGYNLTDEDHEKENVRPVVALKYETSKQAYAIAHNFTIDADRLKEREEKNNAGIQTSGQA